MFEISLQRHCLSPECIRDTNKIKCDQCNQFTESLQRPTYPKLPRILIVHLGRFDNSSNKVTTAIPIPFRMDCFCIECGGQHKKHQYHLYSMIVHLGATAMSGHYLAYVRANNESETEQYQCNSRLCCQIHRNNTESDGNYDDIFSDQWYICDDHEITAIPQNQLQEKVKNEATTKTPYILFYARVDLPNHSN